MYLQLYDVLHTRGIVFGLRYNETWHTIVHSKIFGWSPMKVQSQRISNNKTTEVYAYDSLIRKIYHVYNYSFSANFDCVKNKICYNINSKC